MILSNVEIIRCLQEKLFTIDPIEGADPTNKPFNTSAIDLRLGTEITVPHKEAPASLDLRKGNIAKFWATHSDTVTITEDQPFRLPHGRLVLAKTLETVDFPLRQDGQCFAARVEGKSSLARCGIMVHFTAPTIHAGFSGTITLEVINFGPFDFLLTPGMSICQLIIEEVKGKPADKLSQFHGQKKPVGVI